jgi:hypothetical protein
MGDGISPARVLALAAERAGSDDFGVSGYEEGLERVLDAIARLPLTEAARAGALDRVVQDLANRARIEGWYRQHAEIESQRIEQPVFVVGLPRTGTTATVGMMALDPRFRFLRAWEGSNPVPPPVAGEEADDPRRLAAINAGEPHSPRNMHISDSDGPEEDPVFLYGLDMHAYYGFLPMPQDYTDWWISADFRSTYALHERALKLLQSAGPPRPWLLKGPVHLFHLETLAAQYPDARFVMTHRDPAKAIPSVASLQINLHAARCESGRLDKRERGRMALDFWAQGIERGLAARARIGDERFVDVFNDEVVRDPLAALGKVYDHIGMDIAPDLARGIVDYSRRNAPGAHGKHEYTLEEYGLEESAIRAAFAGYLDRFFGEKVNG